MVLSIILNTYDDPFLYSARFCEIRGAKYLFLLYTSPLWIIKKAEGDAESRTRSYKIDIFIFYHAFILIIIEVCVCTCDGICYDIARYLKCIIFSRRFRFK